MRSEIVVDAKLSRQLLYCWVMAQQVVVVDVLNAKAAQGALQIIHLRRDLELQRKCLLI